MHSFKTATGLLASILLLTTAVLRTDAKESSLASVSLDSSLVVPPSTEGVRFLQTEITAESVEDHGHDHDHDHDHSSHEEEESSEFAESGSKPWGIVIWTSMLVNLTTLVGAVLIGGHWTRNLFCKNWNPDPSVGQLWINVIIPMFACGTLMATTFFLLLPESLHMIQDGLAEAYGGGHEGHNHRMLAGGHDDEGPGEAATTWRWGASIMGGFLFPVMLHAFFPHIHVDSHTHDDDDEKTSLKSAKPADVDATTETAGVDASAKPADATPAEDLEKPASEAEKTEEGSANAIDDEEYRTILGCLRLKNLSLFVAMNLGEMLHNFTDGVFIGAAYQGCSPTVGHAVVIATVLHEIPNQLAGYLVMVNQNGIDPVVALFVNFVFGLSVLLGGVFILLFDIGNVAVGCIFALGGGIFLQVAISEMLGTAERNVKRKRHTVYVLLSFVVGAICIGLVLINHEHCGGHDH